MTATLDLGQHLSAWYVARVLRRGSADDARRAFAEAVAADPALRAAALRRSAELTGDVLARDFIGRIHKELLEGIA